MTTLELLKEAIEVGHPRDAQALVYQCLEEGLSSSEIILEMVMVEVIPKLPCSVFSGTANPTSSASP